METTWAAWQLEDTIQEEFITHDIIEWSVNYKALQQRGHCIWSPRFGFSNLTYKLMCTCIENRIDLSWEVFTPFIPISSSKHLLCWAGLKRSDKTYYHRIGVREIKSSEVGKVSVLSSYFLSDLQMHDLIQNGHLNFFFRLRAEQESIKAQACTSSRKNILWLNKDMIREDIVAHDIVEWNIEYKTLQKEGSCIWIPRFCFSNVTFKLMCTCTQKTIDLSLEVFTFRRKNSSEHLLCWAGLKRSDGIYYHRIERTEIKGSGRETVLVLNSYLISDLKRHHLTQDGCLTFFLRLSEMQEPIKAQTCTNGVPDALLSSVGRIRQNGIAKNHVEWNIDYEALLENKLLERTHLSPLFRISNQTFSLAFSCHHQQIVLSLKQFTPPLQGSSEGVLCWQGLKRSDGTYHHIIECKELNLTESYLSNGTTLSLYVRSEFEKQHLMPDGHIAFFLRFNVEQPITGAKLCTNGGLDVSPRDVGRIVEEDWTSYRRVEWSVDWKPSPECVNENVSSPVFIMENQRYLWGLIKHANDITLCIFRMGTSVDRVVRWWITANLGDGPFHHNGSQCGTLDLKDEECALWTPIKNFKGFTHLDGSIRLTVDFLMEQVPTAAEACIHVDCQSSQDFKHSETGHVTFLVKGMEFKVLRALLQIRVPALGAMFLHDYVENRTGVVHIEDCEPSIFESFLNFAYSGDPSEVTFNNVCLLHMVADKYLFEELKVECLKFIELHKESLAGTLSTEDMQYLRCLEIFN